MAIIDISISFPINNSLSQGEHYESVCEWVGKQKILNIEKWCLGDGTVFLHPSIDTFTVVAASALEESYNKYISIITFLCYSQITQEELWTWVEYQDILCIEDISRDGDIITIIPHFISQVTKETRSQLVQSFYKNFN